MRCVPRRRDVVAVAVVVVTAAVTILLRCPAATAVNVLAIEPLPARSHWNFMRAVLRTMATGGGHNVTVYTPFAWPEDAAGVCAAGRGHEPGCGYAELPLELGVPDKVSLDVASAVENFGNERRFMGVAVDKSRTACDTIDRMAAAGRFSAVRYDLVVVELVSSECTSRVAGRLGDVPLVYVFPSPIASWMEARALATRPSPSYAARLFARYAVPDTFARRLDNAYGWAVTDALQWFHGRGDDESLYRKPAVMFVNSDPAVEKSVPAPPNMIRVGGLHLPPAGPIGSDILEFIENSPHGVICLTFGTVVAFSSLPDHIQKSFKDAIAEVPQKVLLKYEGEMKDKPKNVMIRKWLPQRDILLHPNVKLFIGHGGISGVYEAVDAGVPMLGFPLFFDQPRNIDNLVNAGMAISLDLFSITKDSLLDAINEMINNETYLQNAKYASALFKDRPISPAKSVVYWTEYVIRHKGAQHLKSAAHSLKWYQYCLLDIYALITFMNICILFALYRGIKLIIYIIMTKLYRY